MLSQTQSDIKHWYNCERHLIIERFWKVSWAYRGRLRSVFLKDQRAFLVKFYKRCKNSDKSWKVMIDSRISLSLIKSQISINHSTVKMATPNILILLKSRFYVVQYYWSNRTNSRLNFGELRGEFGELRRILKPEIE